MDGQGTVREVGPSVWDRRTNNFDFLRLALAVLVIFSHSYPLGLGSERDEPMMRWTHGQITGGGVAVDLFFVMSGFLISASASRSRGVLEFMRKRVARIYPAFVVAAVLTAAVVVRVAGGHWTGVGNFLAQTLRLREFGYAGAFAGNAYPGAINGSVWSVQYEFWCYVGVAGLLAAGLLRRRGVVLGMFGAALLVSVGFAVRGWVFGGKWAGVVLGSPQLWARLLPLYLAGVVFYLFRERILLSGWVAAGAAGAMVGASWMPYGWVALFPVAGTYLVFYLAFAPWLRIWGFGRFGDFSYGTYLYAFPVMQMVVHGLGGVVRPWVLFGLAAPVTVLLAVASWYGVERRFLGRRQRGVLLAKAGRLGE